VVANATAVIYTPKQEDFGLVGAETLLAGETAPRREWGVHFRYQVNPGVTGELFEPTVDSIRATVREFDPAEYNTENIQDEAHKYRYEKFENQLRSRSKR